MRIGLRVDVDTFRGTRDGVPRLLEILLRHQVRASFFFSVGPDNMGRHIFRLLRPRFLIKMLRSRAASLYGPEVILQGVIFPGRRIAKNNCEVIRACHQQGHEIGVHAWDHHYWQAHCEKTNERELKRRLDMAYAELTEITGTPPVCSACAGFRTTEVCLRVKDGYGFRYNADCRGDEPFMPVTEGGTLNTPQIPFSTPTYDEAIGKNGVTDEDYYDYLLDTLMSRKSGVLTIHAEVEGGRCSRMFEEFLT